MLALLIGYPLAYAIATRGGKWRTALILLVILPSLTTYLVRTLAWQTILDDSSPTLDIMRSLGLVGEDGRLLATTGAVIAGITYNFLPFMILPLYASLERFDKTHAGGRLRPLREPHARRSCASRCRCRCRASSPVAADVHPGGRRLRQRAAAWSSRGST